MCGGKVFIPAKREPEAIREPALMTPNSGLIIPGTAELSPMARALLAPMRPGIIRRR